LKWLNDARIRVWSQSRRGGLRDPGDAVDGEVHPTSVGYSPGAFRHTLPRTDIFRSAWSETVSICFNGRVSEENARFPKEKTGGSGGARTRHKSNNDAAKTALPSQTAPQEPVTAGHDLSKVVTAWGKLPASLKTAILAIVKSVE